MSLSTASTRVLSDHCMHCLKYFGLFKYPLTADEVLQYLAVESNRASVAEELNALHADGQIEKNGEFYAISNIDELIDIRRNRQDFAVNWLNKSRSGSRIIASFPFVRAIGISGSLSKFQAEKESDIDYFIVTEKNRLWIARTLLHLFKKFTFIFGKEHHFCMNYFVDETGLTISGKGYYSAIELKTLLPVYGEHWLKMLQTKNTWTHNFLPNFHQKTNTNYTISPRFEWVKFILEGLLDVIFPNKLNVFFMNWTDKKWRKKWQQKGYDMTQYNRAFETTLHSSKNHPTNYETIVVDKLQND